MLTFASWLKAHTSVEFDFLLLKDGPLRAQFAALATTFSVAELEDRTSLSERVRRKVRPRDLSEWQALATARLGLERYTVAYGNSIVCLRWIAGFKEACRALRCVCAVHELNWVIGQFFAFDEVRRLLRQIDRVVAGSQAVQRNLVARFSLLPERIEVVHSFLEAGAGAPGNVASLRQEMEIEDADFVVVAVAAAELRKGTDLVAPIVSSFVRRHPDRRLRFVWLGAGESDSMVRMCRLDAEQLGVTEQLSFVAARPSADDFIAMADVFALPSREDPFPLVVLTAIRLGKPVVAFAGSGGMDELLSDGAGRLVPYLDVAAFADAIFEFADDPQSGSAVAHRARAKLDADYDAAGLAHRLYAALVPGEGEALR